MLSYWYSTICLFSKIGWRIRTNYDGEFGRTEKKIKKEFEIETRTEDLLELALELEEKSLGSFEMCYQSLVKFKGDINAVSNYLLDSKHNWKYYYYSKKIIIFKKT